MSGNANVMVKREALTADALAIGLGTLATAVAAQIQVPWEPVPFTMQTFAVVTVAATLGLRRGVLSQAAYLGAGAVGVPWFALGKSGIATLFGPTGGYLLAFLVAAALVGRAADRKKGIWLVIPAALLSILVLGTAWLSLAVGLPRAAELGFTPFVIPEMMKAAMAFGAITAFGAWRSRG